MARRPSNTSTIPSTSTISTEENIVSTETEAPVEAVATEAVETPVEVTEPKAEVVIDLSAFEAAVNAAWPNHDTVTGVLANSFIDPVTAEYRKLEGGVKVKNSAKRYVEDLMKASMATGAFLKARALIMIIEHLIPGSSATVKAEKVPTDPTEAFVQKVTVLRLAHALTSDMVPEGVKEDWKDLVRTSADASLESAKAYLAWTTSEAEDKGDEPEAEAFVKASVKLALGKSVKVSGATRSVSTYVGDRRDIEKHVTEAFAGLNSGDFLKIAEIRKFVSSEYGQNLPSAGAISARLFPKGNKPCTIEGVSPSSDTKGNKGAVKN